MKTFAILLLVANAALAAWLALSGPLGQTREPGRLALQVGADHFRVVSEAELERQRAEQALAADASRAQGVDLPRPDCVVVSGFSSGAAAHRILTRLNAQVAGLRAAPLKDDATELRIEGVTDTSEAALQKILTEFPRVSLAHCLTGVSAPAKP